MIETTEVLLLHEQTVERWHHESVSTEAHQGIMGLICEQHARNFKLWHQEDIARCPLASDQELAGTKRQIDQLNQSRNDLIEQVDDWIAAWLHTEQVTPAQNATTNSETPGSIIDRLSIMSLRMYHLREQLEREGVSPSHLERVIQKLAICDEQLTDLSSALCELLQDIESGKKQHKIYRQFKMYNDPTLNPYLYSSHEATTEEQPQPTDLLRAS